MTLWLAVKPLTQTLHTSMCYFEQNIQYMHTNVLPYAMHTTFYIHRFQYKYWLLLQEYMPKISIYDCVIYQPFKPWNYRARMNSQTLLKIIMEETTVLSYDSCFKPHISVTLPAILI